MARVIEQHLTNKEPREAFGALKGWYRSAGPKPTHPSREEINATRVEYQNLFQSVPPSSPEIPIHVTPFQINDEQPSEEEIIEVLGTLKNGKAAGPSGI